MKIRIPYISVLAFGIVLVMFLITRNANATELKNEEVVENLKVASTIAVDDNVEEEIPEKDYEVSGSLKYDFAELKAVNSDITAWISIPGTTIDYPVMYDGTDDYLHKGVNGESTKSGSLYFDPQTKNALNDNVTIIYGHNMKDGSMFHYVNEYGNSDFYQTHNIVNISTENGDYTLHAVAAIVGVADASCRNLTAATVANFAVNKSLVGGSLDNINLEKPLTILVTCNYSGSDYRMYLLLQED